MRGAVFAACLFLFAAPVAALAQDGGLQVSPVIITMPAERGLASLRVRNGRAGEAAFEMDVFAWSQAGGESVLTPSEALIVAPSVFAVAGGRTQIVRLALAPGARGAGREQSFRIVLRELPRGPAPTGASRILLEFSIPVFATPRGLAPALAAERTRTADGRPALRLANRGAASAALGGVLRAPDATPVLGAPRYLLAGAEIVMPLEADIEAVRVRWAAAGTPFPVEETIALAPPLVLADRR